jgi:hypothetical protein
MAAAECPICSGPRGEGPHVIHPQACRFTAGSLYCVNEPCANPHQRARPAVGAPGETGRVTGAGGGSG